MCTDYQCTDDVNTEDRGRGQGFGVIVDGTTNAYKKVKLERSTDKKVERVTKKVLQSDINYH